MTSNLELDELDNILRRRERAVSMNLFVERLPKKKVSKITRSNSIRSQNIKLDVKDNVLSSNKILEIKNGRMKKLNQQ